MIGLKFKFLYLMILLIRPKLFRKNFNGMALWPFVVLKHHSLKNDAILINHEKIHLRQQAELLIVGFYLWYGIEFLIRWIKYKDQNTAYRNISFEKEAYKNENNSNYLKCRTPFAFLNFYSNKP